MTLAARLRTQSAYMTLKEVAKLFDSHPQTLYKACREGRMPHCRIGNRIKFDPRSIADYLEKRNLAG
jgi:excisionase family DNA binding protein